MKILKFLLVIIFIVPNNLSKAFCNHTLQTMDFDTRINIIHSKVVDLTNIFALHNIKEFNDVYFEPLKYKESVIKYIQKPVIFENKIIAMCMLTRLPLDEYVSTLNVYFNLYKEKKIKEQLLDRCIFNEFDTDYRLIRNFKNSKVQMLIISMIHCKRLSKDFRYNLKDVIEGRSYKALKNSGSINE